MQRYILFILSLVMVTVLLTGYSWLVKKQIPKTNSIVTTKDKIQTALRSVIKKTKQKNGTEFSDLIGSEKQLVNEPSNKTDRESTSSQPDSTQQQLSKESAEQCVRDFYDNINIQNFVQAYSLIGSKWQGQMSYEKFRNGYTNTVSDDINSMTSSELSGNIQVVITVKAVERVSGTTKINNYKITYVIGTEDNQIKILEGKGQLRTTAK